jgi:hypothetical protein
MLRPDTFDTFEEFQKERLSDGQARGWTPIGELAGLLTNTLAQGATIVDDILEHHGIKGMKWGVRRENPSGPTSVTVQKKGKKLKTSGGKNLPAHSDAVTARVIGQKGKGSGLTALSNRELEEYSRRMSLEANVKRLNYANSNVAKKFVLTLLGQTGKAQASAIANDVASTQVKKHITKRLVKAGAVAAA